MAGRYLGGERPAPRAASDASLSTAWARARATYAAKLDTLLLHDALTALWEFVNEANRFVEAEQPWALAKAAKANDAGAEVAEARLAGVLGDLIEAVRLVSLAVAPFMPSIAPRALAQLGHEYPYRADGNGGPPLLDLLEWGAGSDRAGRLGSPEPLFPRLETETALASASS
jgi:methionyl-tRNA synthetase